MYAFPPVLEEYAKLPIAVFGRGVSGRAVAGLLDKLGRKYVIYDKCAEIQRDFTNEAARGHNLVIFSPGFNPKHPWFKIAATEGCKCIGEWEFGAQFWKGSILAITGTNGKSTLTDFLSRSLTRLGKKAVACGNIGLPLSSCDAYFDDPEAIAVCEVSSAQAESIKYFPVNEVLWTQFDADHLDWHGSIEKYFSAKWNLVKSAKNGGFVGKTVVEAAVQFGYTLPENVKLAGPVSDEVVEGTVFQRSPQRENFELAWAYWNSHDFDRELLIESAKEYKLIKHRMHRVGEVAGVGFWNDSKGTNFSASLAALSGFDSPVMWIAGGKDKGGDIKSFARDASSYISGAVLIGEVSNRLDAHLKALGVESTVVSTMEAAVEEAWSRCRASKGLKEVVLSPGFSSLDMFKNFEERGNSFEDAVLMLKSEKREFLNLKAN